MLEQITRIKQRPFEVQFHHDDINDIITSLQSLGFISRSRPQVRLSHPVEVRKIKTAAELERIAKTVDSCLHNPHKKDQLAAYTRFLADPGALYFSFASPPYEGYFRFYAGELVSSRDSVLFEDVLRSRDRSQETKRVTYSPEFKAIVLKTMEAMGILEDGYLYVPLGDVDSYGGQQLRVRKMGSTFFKKGFGDWFYRGDVAEEGWPRFENAQVLWRE